MNHELWVCPATTNEWKQYTGLKGRGFSMLTETIHLPGSGILEEGRLKNGKRCWIASRTMQTDQPKVIEDDAKPFGVFHTYGCSSAKCYHCFAVLHRIGRCVLFFIERGKRSRVGEAPAAPDPDVPPLVPPPFPGKDLVRRAQVPGPSPPVPPAAFKPVQRKQVTVKEVRARYVRPSRAQRALPTLTIPGLQTIRAIGHHGTLEVHGVPPESFTAVADQLWRHVQGRAPVVERGKHVRLARLLWELSGQGTKLVRRQDLLAAFNSGIRLRDLDPDAKRLLSSELSNLLPTDLVEKELRQRYRMALHKHRQGRQTILELHPLGVGQ